MRLSFRNLSIRKKLTALMMIVSVLILLLVSGLYMAEEYFSTKAYLEREMTVLGSALGDSCKKLLMMRDLKTTEEILASLNVQPNVRAAYLFDENGEPIAQYVDPTNNQFILQVIPQDFTDPNDFFWVRLKGMQKNSSWQHFSLFLPIMHDDRQVGSIYLLSDLRDLYDRLNHVVFVVLLFSGLLLILSWWLSGKLQRPVSVPLLDLADTMGTISEEKDFSLRAEKSGHDEIGLLVDGFNNMLEQIEINRQELVDHQQSLEMTVDRRTEELRKMVAVLNIAKQQAEAASEAKSQFLANITHELRTPLIGVLGMNELMFRTSMDEQQQMLATTVQSSGENLLTLINNVLDYSKIEAGKMQLEEQEFALYQTLDDVLNLLTAAADEKGLSLYSDIPLSATSRVLGDELRVRQILMNLIGNAIKFTERGSVTVKLQCHQQAAEQVSFEIEICDTGIGMDEQAQKQIFSAFEQADTSHTRKYGGTGLGLAIVQQLVDLLNGKLSLTSKVGEGSCFKINFALPLVAEGEFPLPESLQHQSVLLCTPDQSCRQFLADRLTALGLCAVAADSAENAWYQLRAASRQQKPFELVFLSETMSMPEGQPLYQALRDEDTFKHSRRILMLKRSDFLDLQPQEQKLYLPIGWDELYKTICRSWHELHVVSQPEVAIDTSASPINTVAVDRLLLAGGTVPSRELIKVALADMPLEFHSAKNLMQLEEKAAENNYAAILIDLSGVDSTALVAWCNEGGLSDPLFVLCSEVSEADSLTSWAAGVMLKPFSRDDFISQLQPLLTQAKTENPTLDCGAGA